MELYYSLQSAPCRSVLLTSAALDIPLIKKPIRLRNKDHLSPEFIALNPQHTVPTLVHAGYAIWERFDFSFL